MSDTPNGERRGGRTNGWTDRGTSRRRFLKATAGAGAIATGLGAGAIGNATAKIIPTPWLHRDGNLVKDPSGNRVVLRGLNIPDPKRNDSNAAWRPTTNEYLNWVTDAERGWHSRIVRLPAQATDIGGHDYGGIPDMPGFTEDQLLDYLENYMDPAVEKCAELGIYCIVDYHRHREQGEEYLYTSDETHDELTMFWENVAPRYAEYSNVIYEVYNEPIGPFPGHGDPNTNVAVTEQRAKEEGWDVWKEAAQPWVNTIREHAPRNHVIIGSPRWSQYTYWAPENEFDGDNLGYVGHVYAHPNLRPLGKYFGTPAEDVPMWMTEFGWGQHGASYINGSEEEDGQQFLNFFEEYDHVHNTVWCFDAKWRPAMLEHDFETLNSYGQFWKDFLARLKDADLPSGSGTTPPDPGTTEPPTTEPPTTEPPDPGETPPEWPDGTQPTDPNDDDVFEDLNGNERIDSDDVVVYFENYDQPYMADNAGFYDLNDNGRTDSDDVVQLFQSL